MSAVIDLAARRKERAIDAANDRDSAYGEIVDQLGVAKEALIEATTEAASIQAPAIVNSSLDAAVNAVALAQAAVKGVARWATP